MSARRRTATRVRTGAALVAAAAIAVASAGMWTRATSSVPQEDLPAALAGRANPRAHDVAAVSEGAAIFASNCASCHGAHADGRGDAAPGLVPPPANFRGGDVLARHSDAYLFYRVSEGKPGTAMPSFRAALGEDERWAVIAYLRSIAPDGAPKS